MDWESLIKYLSSVSVLAAAFAYIGKKVVEAFLNSRTEKYKSNLEKIATEHSIRYQQLHSERALAIKEMYQKTVELDLALTETLKSFYHISEPKGKGVKSALGSCFELC